MASFVNSNVIVMLKDMHALTTGKRGTTFPKGSRDRPDERQLNAILSLAVACACVGRPPSSVLFSTICRVVSRLRTCSSVRIGPELARSVCFKWQGANSLFPPLRYFASPLTEREEGGEGTNLGSLARSLDAAALLGPFLLSHSAARSLPIVVVRSPSKAASGGGGATFLGREKRCCQRSVGRRRRNIQGTTRTNKISRGFVEITCAEQMPTCKILLALHFAQYGMLVKSINFPPNISSTYCWRSLPSRRKRRERRFHETAMRGRALFST